jgi:hypothetical protein
MLQSFKVPATLLALVAIAGCKSVAVRVQTAPEGLHTVIREKGEIRKQGASPQWCLVKWCSSGVIS